MNKVLEIISKKRGYDGFFKIDCIEFKHSLFQGGMTPIISRELFGRGQAVVVLLYDTATQQVVLVEQCRAGALMHAYENPNNAWLLEPVAGMIDHGEKPYDACVRECQEEASIQVLEFEPIYQFYPSPGGSDEVLHLFAAEIDAQLVPDYAGLAEDHEDIRLVKLSFSEAKQRLMAAEFNVASTLIGLQWLFFQKLAV
ncbi:NUDIX domain-containing protein [Thiosulfativibrio zosterae]|uniref:ADP-ribose pyrophosphatase n=1 Tax=Thiosulfativibrio zosterae TaxID=2675053 RepID=A0A6F8PNA0_9GAMM|nr:NUDIX domain-containing protein [Thiosulfativibrio zosterae]BBP43575.1 ADP-ribose pyrophosphatase [Thiosulfativibrio zosterae]